MYSGRATNRLTEGERRSSDSGCPSRFSLLDMILGSAWIHEMEGQLDMWLWQCSLCESSHTCGSSHPCVSKWPPINPLAWQAGLVWNPFFCLSCVPYFQSRDNSLQLGIGHTTQGASLTHPDADCLCRMRRSWLIPVQEPPTLWRGGRTNTRKMDGSTRLSLGSISVWSSEGSGE